VTLPSARRRIPCCARRSASLTRTTISWTLSCMPRSAVPSSRLFVTYTCSDFARYSSTPLALSLAYILLDGSCSGLSFLRPHIPTWLSFLFVYLFRSYYSFIFGRGSPEDDDGWGSIVPSEALGNGLTSPHGIDYVSRELRFWMMAVGATAS
jgi:hypothetical protein